MTSLDQHIEACIQGDVNRFEEVVAACESRVRGIIAAMVPDPGTVPDLTQEVFVIAYKRLTTYRPGTNFAAWIGTIARNVAQNERRRWYRSRQLQRDYQAEAEYQLAENIDRFVESLPEETLAALQDCVDGLHGKTRSLVDGFYQDRCSIKELSDILKMTTGAAKVALHRARQALGKCIQKKGHDV
ncbi:MAG: sigma-70 family RNA polymerase sigma factor [Kiritimatiellia bacterium]|jgi:RNA polymerase sigma-70 factor (ECF subfamily)|nr:sigma-70 family RNA polymerase sigma factor [Kiritimatiellia bacterium]